MSTVRKGARKYRSGKNFEHYFYPLMTDPAFLKQREGHTRSEPPLEYRLNQGGMPVGFTDTSEIYLQLPTAGNILSIARADVTRRQIIEIVSSDRLVQLENSEEVRIKR